MQKLRDGFARFRHDEMPERAARFAALAGGQSPRVIVITCSDSRIDLGLICQTEPGEIFVIRNAGNIVPADGSGAGGEVATIEYAIKVLRVPQILICGHSQCGAMGAVLDPDSAAGLEYVREWITHAHFAKDEGTDLDTLIQRNVLLQISNLRSYAFIREAEARGALSIHGWVYRFETGDVLQYNPEKAAFEPLPD